MVKNFRLGSKKGTEFFSTIRHRKITLQYRIVNCAIVIRSECRLLQDDATHTATW